MTTERAHAAPHGVPGRDEGPGPALPVAEAFRRLARLSPAQRTMLTHLGRAGEPVTVATLAAEVGVRASTARETLDGLLAAGLVRRERMPITGPGRPSFGYVAAAPTGVDEPMGMFVGLVTATAATLRASVPDPEGTARAIGRTWAEEMVGGVLPDHAGHDESAYAALDLTEHIDKIAYFFTALGFGAFVEEGRRRIGLRSCPFLRDGVVDPLVCEMHRGMTGRVIDLTSRGRAEADLRPWVTADTCEVALVERPGAD